jgi:hypothetical protein
VYLGATAIFSRPTRPRVRVRVLPGPAARVAKFMATSRARPAPGSGWCSGKYSESDGEIDDEETLEDCNMDTHAVRKAAGGTQLKAGHPMHALADKITACERRAKYPYQSDNNISVKLPNINRNLMPIVAQQSIVIERNGRL